MGRSNPVPSFRMSAGARFTVTLFSGNRYPEFFMAALMRSRLSFTAASGRPTVENWGRPDERSTSTSTGNASMPTTVLLRTLTIKRATRENQFSLKLYPVAHIISRFEICKHFRLPFSRGLRYEKRLDNIRKHIANNPEQDTGDKNRRTFDNVGIHVIRVSSVRFIIRAS
ncbi:MAG: hypothetical protein A4E67_01596 [Syntrophaceae bacterium PtaB.Bin038]|nr:MAG: hypothetical protein A4E67_01596 [Syntrophaceae bacterium PtaB.Bin038]